MNEALMLVAAFLAGAGVGALLLFGLQAARHARGIARARETAESIIKQAEEDAGSRIQAASLEAKVRLEAAEEKIEEESQQRIREMEEQRLEIERRDGDLRRRIAFADDKMERVERREAALAQVEEETRRLKEEAERLLTHQRGRLEQIAGYSAQEAREELKKEMELDARREAAATLLRLQEETRERASEESRWIVTQAMQRMPLSQYAEATVTVIELPSEEMKGRIIGREGRNIRSIEMSVGVDLIIDDTPGVIIVSSFDPARRMIAKLSIEKLIEDGRIHPARIEEVTNKVKEDFDKIVLEQGEAAAFELGLADFNPKLLKMAGRLRYISYHGQNILEHSREVAELGAYMAALLTARSEIVKRAGFLHKIGFADEASKDSSPLILSAEIVQRLSEPEAVVHCIQSLYGLVAPRSVEAVLLRIAENASVARPGAQKEMLQDHIERLGALEQIAGSFNGVRSAYAVRAGKEVRVIVSAEELTDKESVWLSKDIARRIERETKYPGQLRVTVIRETRSVGYAM